MASVIFARPRTDYDPYNDLYALIALSGYPLVYFDEVDADSDNTYVLTMSNGENAHGWKSPRARIILYQFEWTLGGTHQPPPGVAQVWTGDYGFAQRIGARHVPVGSHPQLNPQAGIRAEKQWDVALLMYMTGRRQPVRERLREHGVTIAPDGWGNARHGALMRSRCMVYAAQWDEAPYIAPLRLALAAAYRLPFVAETPADPRYTPPCFKAKIADLGDFTARLLRGRPQDLQLMGDLLYDDLCKRRTFRRCIEGAV